MFPPTAMSLCGVSSLSLLACEALIQILLMIIQSYDAVPVNTETIFFKSLTKQYYTTKLIIRCTGIQTHYPTTRHYHETKILSITRCFRGHITNVKIAVALYEIGVF